MIFEWQVLVQVPGIRLAVSGLPSLAGYPTWNPAGLSRRGGDRSRTG